MPRVLPLVLSMLAVACVPVTPDPHIGSTPPVDSTTLPKAPVKFEFDSLDERSFSSPALRGKPAVLAFIVSDTMAGQGEADILVSIAQKQPNAASYGVVFVEPAERRELVLAFVRFFADKSHVSLLAAMADKDTILGQGPFGDVSGVTVVVLDAGGRMVFRRTGVVPASEIVRAIARAAVR